jgi:DNA polymerase (family 10)
MPIQNSEIADLFEQLADLLDIEEANPFRVRAYRNAARMLRDHPRSMAELVAAGEELSALPSIGKDLAGKIRTIVETGRLPLLDETAKRTPRVLSELLKIEGIGPKRVKALYRSLDIRSTEDLRRAAEAGRIRRLPGFGPKTEQAIRAGIDRLGGRSARLKLSTAESIAKPLSSYLQRCPGVKAVTVAGSYRRRKETVGDLDVLVAAARGARVMDHWAAYEEIAEIVSQGETRSTARLRDGVQVDLRVVPQVSYGAALHYFTGSKAHNIAVRRIAARKGYKVNEYGVFRGDERIAGKTEAEVFASIGLPYIPPELREDRGEIQAARRGRLPELVGLDDIRGDLHCHTDASDGRSTLEEIAAAAAERGYEYVSINDHSKRLAIAHGLDERRLIAQIKAIDELNAELDGITVLKSAEVDILKDGSLDLPNRVLNELDFTVCAVHSHFDLPARRQTERILRAMDNPHLAILAHPTGRLINDREPYAIDIEAIVQAAKDRGCILELNAHPDRLDLNDDGCRLAKAAGVKVAISTDAHRAEQLEFMRYGVDQARRAWLGAGDVVNTRGLEDLRKLLRRA